MLLLIADCITIWPFIEHAMAMSLGLLLGSNTDASLAVFATLRSGRNQRDAIAAAAEAQLTPAGQELVTACLSVFRTAEKIRNDLAHGNWGILEDSSSDLVWVEAKYHAPWNTAAIQTGRRAKRPTHADLEKHFYVYTEKDLREHIETLEHINRLARDLRAWLQFLPEFPPALAEQIFDRLSAEPLIREALDHQRRAKSKK